jgi:two-component system sensor histidine kinase BaeS
MRLRIVHQLSLLLAGIALLTAVAMGGLLAWNLRAGFSDYLRSRDEQQLERFAEVVAQRVDWRELGGSARLPMRELMDEFLTREGFVLRPEAPPPEPGAGGEPPRPGRGPGIDLPQRIQVVDVQGQRIGGPPFPPGRELIERPVALGGRTVAFVRMLPSLNLGVVDSRFLRRQYQGLAAALAAALALALGGAVFAARWLGAPLQTVKRATHRIAEGELDVVVPESGSREMAELIHDVNRMAASLQQLEGARRRWIAQISHELRTPLSVLLGELESVQDGVRATTPELIANLRDEVLQLVRLVNDLHTLSMADLGALPCDFAEGDVGSTIERVMQRMRARLQQAGLGLELQPGPELQAEWDHGRISQLLGNLLENSLRYTDAPGQVVVRWLHEAQAVVLQVDDSAPGVPAHQRDHLFDPLFRLDEARQRVAGFQGGSGLGLVICRAIVQAHGGSIAAAASPLGGLRIEARLPLQLERP